MINPCSTSHCFPLLTQTWYETVELLSSYLQLADGDLCVTVFTHRSPEGARQIFPLYGMSAPLHAPIHIVIQTLALKTLATNGVMSSVNTDNIPHPVDPHLPGP